MLTEQNMSMSKETVIGHRATKTAILVYRGVNKVPIALDMVETAEFSYRMNNEFTRQEKLRKDRNKQKDWYISLQRKWNEMMVQDKTLHVKLQKLKTKAQEAKERVGNCVDQGGKISDELKVSDLMELEARNKLAEFRRQKQSEANKRIFGTWRKRQELRVNFLKLAKVKS